MHWQAQARKVKPNSHPSRSDWENLCPGQTISTFLEAWATFSSLWPDLD
ncbi:hypothetical protein LEMLEM_LOCUS6300, partial [Lemmus lemmus]